jgi:hypothetical protein
MPSKYKPREMELLSSWIPDTHNDIVHHKTTMIDIRTSNRTSNLVVNNTTHRL